MENLKIAIWVAAYLGILFYFAAKFKKLQQDTENKPTDLSFWKFVKQQGVDIVTGLVLGFLFLTYGQQVMVWVAEIANYIGYELPAFNLNLTNPISAFLTGIGIGSVGVNIVLALVDKLIPRVTIGDKSRKEIREIPSV